jgi:hypothetical protein
VPFYFFQNIEFGEKRVKRHLLLYSSMSCMTVYTNKMTRLTRFSGKLQVEIFANVVMCFCERYFKIGPLSPQRASGTPKVYQAWFCVFTELLSRPKVSKVRCKDQSVHSS